MATKATSKKTTKVASQAAYTNVKEHVSSSLASKKLWRSLGAEFIGIFLLTSVIITSQGQPIFVLFGLAGIVLLIGAVSGAHVNPAITVAAWATKRIGWLRALGYILVQVLGAIAAFFVLKTFLGGADVPSAEAAAYGATAADLFKATPVADFAGKEWYALSAAVLGTAIFGYAIAHATRTKDILTAAFSVGFGIFIALVVGITVAGYVGASSILNPAVAASLQVFDASIWSYSIYALAPVVGAIVGFGLYDAIRGNDKAS